LTDGASNSREGISVINERTGKQSEDLLMKSTRNETIGFAVARVKAMGSHWGSLCRWFAVAATLVLLTAGVSFASFSLTFQGLVQTLNTGGGISLSSPAGTVVDSSGDVFVVDTGNNQIVEVNAQGTASVLTVSGLSPSLSSPSGVAVDGTGNLYVADTGNNRVVKITPAGAGSEVRGTRLALRAGPTGFLDRSIAPASSARRYLAEFTRLTACIRHPRA
jgi:NHL repeat